ncbi:MAG: hypothetical protein GTO04_20065, partial [Planctomycetales bacterium]|nr:hypothetical protein [Planctomycetales bacterium]
FDSKLPTHITCPLYYRDEAVNIGEVKEAPEAEGVAVQDPLLKLTVRF